MLNLTNGSLSDENREEIFIRLARHELLTPLSSVVGMLDLVDFGKLSDQTSIRCLQYAKDSAHSLVEQIQLILEFASIPESRPAAIPKVINIKNVISRLANVWSNRATAKGLKFELNLESTASFEACVDIHRLKRILDILLNNAVKFTESGKVILGVGVDGEIWVKDSGVGIETSQLDKIFQPFTQSDNSFSRAYNGMGLGLAIAQKLAFLDNAYIAVVSAQDEGCVFTLHLSK